MLPLPSCQRALLLSLGLWIFAGATPAEAQWGYYRPFWGPRAYAGYSPAYTGISYPMTIGSPSAVPVTSFYGPSWGAVNYGVGYNAGLASTGACCAPCGCNPCGCSSCGDGNCASGNCASGNCPSGNCGTSYSPSTTEPVPDPAANPSPAPSRTPTQPTYRDPPPDRFVPVEPRNQGTVPNNPNPNSGFPSSIPNTNVNPQSGNDAQRWDLPRNDVLPNNRTTNPLEPSIDKDEIIPIVPNRPGAEAQPLHLDAPVASVKAPRGRIVTQASFSVPTVARMPVAPRALEAQTQVAQQ